AEVGRIVADLVPDTNLSIDQETSDRRTYRVSFDRFATATGFSPNRTLSDGIAELRDALLADPAIDIADPHWDNARFLQAPGARSNR
ncbi:MAG: hypothetical protein M3Y37_09200, partial [Chloroflexota bacterium]|nr:hypothetical protein [Chloroflexota bacterium]